MRFWRSLLLRVMVTLTDKAISPSNDLNGREGTRTHDLTDVNRKTIIPNIQPHG